MIRKSYVAVAIGLLILVALTRILLTYKVCDHSAWVISSNDTYPPGAFGWLGQAQPVTKIGKTILLYYIPPGTTDGPTTSPH